MRIWPVFLLIASLLAGCAAPDEMPDDTPSAKMVVQDTLYLHYLGANPSGPTHWLDFDQAKTRTTTSLTISPLVQQANVTFTIQLDETMTLTSSIWNLSLSYQLQNNVGVADVTAHFVLNGKHYPAVKALASGETKLEGPRLVAPTDSFGLVIALQQARSGTSSRVTIDTDGSSSLVAPVSQIQDSDIKITKIGDVFEARLDSQLTRVNPHDVEHEIHLMLGPSSVRVTRGGTDLVITDSKVATASSEAEAKRRVLELDSEFIIESKTTSKWSWTVTSNSAKNDWTGRFVNYEISLPDAASVSLLSIDSPSLTIELDRVDARSSVIVANQAVAAIRGGNYGKFQTSLSSAVVSFTGSVKMEDLDIRFVSGQITGKFQPVATGFWSITGTSGGVDLELGNPSTVGYDATLRIDQGVFNVTTQKMSPAEPTTRTKGHFVSDHYANASIQVDVSVNLDNGSIKLR